MSEETKSSQAVLPTKRDRTPGGKPQRQPGANNRGAVSLDDGPRLDPVSAVYFAGSIMLAGYPGAYQRATTIKPETVVLGSSTAYLKSLHIVDGCILIDGTFWMPIESGAITGYVY